MMKTRNTILGISGMLLMSLQVSAQDYCIPPGFKSMGGSGEPFTFISNVTLENLNNSSGMPTGVGDDNGYMHFTSAATPVLEKGSTYSLRVSANDNLGSGMEVAVWVDWNGDKEFDNISEKVAYWAPAGNHGADITVPANAADGKIRMRVACDMPPGMGHIPLEPCGYLDYPSHPIGQHGEVEDYDLQIGGFTGINDISQSESIKLYPNPASQILNIEHNFKDNITYTIVDVYGRKQMQGIMTKELHSIDVSSLTRGQYILMMEGSSSSVHRPFYVSR